MIPNTLILYTTALCNLHCNYCYIEKNATLSKIDKILDESFKNDYYFNFSKQFFNSNDLIELQLWGAEPTIRLDRALNTIESLINYYPNFSDIMFSTNFTTNNWFNQINKLLKLLNNYSNRHFQINIQLSLDGPELFNDLGRGKNSTQKFLKNWKKFLLFLNTNSIPNNVKLNMFFKPTWSKETLPLLKTKEDIINYYIFFEKFKESCIYYENTNFELSLTIPNVACPGEYTKKDGLHFAKICSLCRQIENENITNHYFKYYNTITPYQPREQDITINNNLFSRCKTCGMGTSSIGLLPNNKISLCHNGFVDLIEEYQDRINSEDNLALEQVVFQNKENILKTNCTIEDFTKIKTLLMEYYKPNTTFQRTQLLNCIKILASYNFIDKKFTNSMEALKAATFIELSTSYCVRDNISCSGSIITIPLGILKLLLNGAMEAIINEKF